jgi:short-subunit dehydrogenase
LSRWRKFDTQNNGIFAEILIHKNMQKKVVIITGVSSGIGRETVVFLNKHGYAVYGGARRVEKLKELELQGVKTLPLDVTDAGSAENFVNEVAKAEGKIDVLINNAGYGEYGAVEDVTLENAHNQLEVNLFGLARMIKLVLPTMRAQKSGKIINISSIGGKMATPMGGWYHASKFAVEGLSDSLRLEVKQFGIDVVVVEPGGIETEWGGIAADTAVKASGNSAYKNFANTVQAFGTSGKAPKPIVIAELIKKIIEKKHPKARYAKGFMAKPILFFRKYLSDRMFDKIISMTLNSFKKQ